MTAPAAFPATAPAEAMLPRRYRVIARRPETADTATLVMEPVDEPLAPYRPGQFSMLGAVGVGDVAISESGSANPHLLTHTVRAVGAVTRALGAAEVGAVLGVRGPFGTGWPLAAAEGRDLLLVVGGLGLAPLRPVVLRAVAHPGRWSRVVLLVGARTPADVLYGPELAAWRHGGIDVCITVDRPTPGWAGPVGVVTTLLDAARLDVDRTVAFACGPEVMMRATVRELTDRGLPLGRMWLSLERNMRCGVAQCGHCQLGPVLLCRDGPVLPASVALPLMLVEAL